MRINPAITTALVHIDQMSYRIEVAFFRNTDLHIAVQFTRSHQCACNYLIISLTKYKMMNNVDDI